MNRMIVALACGLALAVPAGCKIVKTAASGSAAASDPDEAKINAIVADTWDGRLVPLIATEATDAATLVAGIAADLSTAGDAHGHKGAGAAGSWTFAVKGQGQVVAEDRKSRAGKLQVDVNGDGKVDLTLQVGPVVKGTALRDVAPFYDFTAFRDQIQFAKLGRALNDRAMAGLDLPSGDLTGKTVSFSGAFAVHASADPILVVPVVLKVTP